MSRDIKFRAYVNNNLHGTGVFEVVKMDSDIITLKIPNKEDSRACQYVPFFKREYKLMQFTGIHDNTTESNEIYESDNINFIYKGIEYYGTIKYEGAMFMIGNINDTDSCIPLDDIVTSYNGVYRINGEVVGTIYDNVEGV